MENLTEFEINLAKCSKINTEGIAYLENSIKNLTNLTIKDINV